jgi:hypothetical protein
MGLAGSMAAFAPSFCGIDFLQSNAFVMWILEEVLPNVGMARLANGTSDKRRSLGPRYRDSKKERDPNPKPKHVVQYTHDEAGRLQLRGSTVFCSSLFFFTTG